MTTVKELEAQNHALLTQLFARKVADTEAKAAGHEKERAAAEARDAAERAEAQAASVERVRVGAWHLALIEKQVAAGEGQAPFKPTIPEAGWPAGRGPETFGIAPSVKVPDDISGTTIMKLIAAKRGGTI